MQTKLTHEDKKQIMAWRKRGWGYRKIAKRLGKVSYQAIQSWVARGCKVNQYNEILDRLDNIERILVGLEVKKEE